MKTVTAKYAPTAIGPYSQATIINNILYCSGQIPINPTTGEIQTKDISGQTEQVIMNIQAILDEVGIHFDSVFKTTCYLTDMCNFTEFNRVYEKYFISKPSRSCIAVNELPR
ncbi:Rid family detoxifying hydrolase [Acinetobacter nosocomialis]|uniref:Rid family detoxifying hydrolase n=1 Tax=Acinetobacter nosocomialis TaxID=106654 RepID=UPI0026F44E8E|nr:Rid family detoxifying hydrolase [Acinetobacter nosocomialis]MDO7435650.1 Rid family detoxifying hydrolase [Acinetobacter nosocomialis]